MKRSKSGVGLVLMVVASLAILIPAQASGEIWTVRGVVTDLLGRPLEGITVNDGSNVAYTNAQGHYSLPQRASALTQRITVSGTTIESQDRLVAVTQAQESIDFKVAYKAGANFPGVFSLVPITLSLEASTYAPASDLCVTAFDSRDEANIAFTLESVDASGFSVWSADLTVPSEASPGGYSLEYSFADCDSEAELAYSVTRYYFYETGSPPAVTFVAPIAGRSYISNTEVGQTDDGTTRVFGPTTFSVGVVDDCAIRSVIFVLSRGGEELERVSAGPSTVTERTWSTSRRFTFLDAPGEEYSVTVIAEDMVGQTTNSSFTVVTGP